MSNPQPTHRPNFEEALAAWKSILLENGYSANLQWIVEENLCFETDPGTPAGVKLGFQIQITPPPTDAAKVTYHHFAETENRVVFYRLGSHSGRSICMVLCDEWFEARGEDEGYIRRDDWQLSFYPGHIEKIEEVIDPKRWRERVIRGRPLTAVDFCMTMSALHELKAHGRVLSADERLGLSILRSMQRK